MFIYSIFDKKAVSFGPLFIAENDEVSKRIVSESIDRNTFLSSFPADFALYRIGEFNIDNGDVSGINPIVLVCEILSLFKVDKNGKSE